MTTTTLSGEPSGETESTFEPVDTGCTSNNNTTAEAACYDPCAACRRASMNLKRTATIVAIGGALLAWLAGAATSNREIAPAPISRSAPIEARGAELAVEVARLHERLRPTATPRHPGRNLFTFRAAVVRSAPAPVAAPRPALVE